MSTTSKLKPAPTLKDYWQDNERFADLFNQVFFRGKETIKASKLSVVDTDESSVVINHGQLSTVVSARDVIKLHNSDTELAFVAIENQMNVDYTMPVRTMLYDALRYVDQCKDLYRQNRKAKTLQGSGEFLSGMSRTDRLKPVITLVLYFGEKSWDGPTKLSDILDIPNGFAELYNDHTLHLLQVRDTQNLKFQNQDNREFFSMIHEFYNHDGRINYEELREKYAQSTINWEVLAAVGAVTNSKPLIKYAYEHQRGEINMCTALANMFEEWKEQGIEEGKQEGIEQGIEQGKEEGATARSLQIARNMLSNGMDVHLVISMTELSKDIVSEIQLDLAK